MDDESERSGIRKIMFTNTKLGKMIKLYYFRTTSEWIQKYNQQMEKEAGGCTRKTGKGVKELNIGNEAKKLQKA